MLAGVQETLTDATVGDIESVFIVGDAGSVEDAGSIVRPPPPQPAMQSDPKNDRITKFLRFIHTCSAPENPIPLNPGFQLYLMARMIAPRVASARGLVFSSYSRGPRSAILAHRRSERGWV